MPCMNMLMWADGIACGPICDAIGLSIRRRVCVFLSSALTSHVHTYLATSHSRVSAQRRSKCYLSSMSCFSRVSNIDGPCNTHVSHAINTAHIRYRRVPKSNKRFRAEIAGCVGGNAVLRDAGWEDDGAAWLLPGVPPSIPVLRPSVHAHLETKRKT
jgi:hypothetical protein